MKRTTESGAHNTATKRPKRTIATSQEKEIANKSNLGKQARTKTKSEKISKTKGVYVYDGAILNDDEEVRQRDGYLKPIPEKDSQGIVIFSDAKDFHPNMTPKEVLQAGSFGGTYFRPIKSSVTGLKYNKMWNELPQNWLEGLDINKMVSSNTYDEKVNTYRVKCGGDLHMWESSGWIKEVDPYGWFMWYCRFYLGRRTDDDERQIRRWKNCAGPKGRWKNNLIGKIARAGVAFDNSGVSPVVRQTLQHWGYKLTEKDYKEGKKRIKI